jgi:hypothetical protein
MKRRQGRRIPLRHGVPGGNSVSCFGYKRKGTFGTAADSAADSGALPGQGALRGDAMRCDAMHPSSSNRARMHDESARRD